MTDLNPAAPPSRTADRSAVRQSQIACTVALLASAWAFSCTTVMLVLWLTA